MYILSIKKLQRTWYPLQSINLSYEFLSHIPEPCPGRGPSAGLFRAPGGSPDGFSLSIILAEPLEICLGMSTAGAELGSFCSLIYISAVAALPEYRNI